MLFLTLEFHLPRQVTVNNSLDLTECLLLFFHIIFIVVFSAHNSITMGIFCCSKRSLKFASVTFVTGFLLLCVVLILNSGTVNRQKKAAIPPEVYNIKDKIADLARQIYKAKKHVRGIKTADNLKIAIHLLEGILEDLNIDAMPLKHRSAIKARSVCPEEYKGTEFGSPFFYKGFEIKECDYGKSVTDLLTITAYIKEDMSDNLEKAVSDFLSSIRKLNSKYQIAIAANIASATAVKFTKQFQNAIIRDITKIKGLSAGQIWNNLVETAETEYVLIARNVEMITDDTRFDRLIRELESMELSAAGGSFRTPNGHWSNGCYQVAYKNYSLSYHHGYDESMHECLFCDYIEGAFITTKKLLEITKFKNLDETDGLFEDWFLRPHVKQQSVAVCPDSMFHTYYKAADKENWDSFMKDWELNRLRTPLGKDIVSVSSCNIGMPYSSRSKALSPCASDGLAKAIHFLMTACEEANIICELVDGTAFGAVKFNKILPWERDADFALLTANFSAFQNLDVRFTTANYRLVNKSGVFDLHLPGWRIEIFGQHIMDSELLRAEGLKPTKVILDGQWMSVPRNPGLFMRNRYGHEIYRHALHWLSLGEKTSWINYNTTKFLTCEQPGHHACIDRYNTDGNLQFEIMLP